MDGENYQAMFVCGRAAAWDKPRSERADGSLAVVAEVKFAAANKIPH
jgi:hypothetical protein